MNLSRPLTDHDEICTQVWCGVKLWNLLSKKFHPTPTSWRRKKLEISPTFRRPAVNRKRLTSKRLNISTNSLLFFHLR